jgi:hypothetical protein
VLGDESVRYWTILGGPRKIKKLQVEEGIPTPLCRSREVVEAPDLVTREKAVVLRNAGSRYNVEVVDFTIGNSLPSSPLFSLSLRVKAFYSTPRGIGKVDPGRNVPPVYGTL